jgi:hypothetical protein
MIPHDPPAPAAGASSGGRFLKSQSSRDPDGNRISSYTQCRIGGADSV